MYVQPQVFFLCPHVGISNIQNTIDKNNSGSDSGNLLGEIMHITPEIHGELLLINNGKNYQIRKPKYIIFRAKR
jgi:hypothetical protein